jgi:hypothetical protein
MQGIGSSWETPEIHEQGVQFNRALAVASAVSAERSLRAQSPQSTWTFHAIGKQPTKRLRLSGGSASFILNAITYA